MFWIVYYRKLAENLNEMDFLGQAEGPKGAKLLASKWLGKNFGEKLGKDFQVKWEDRSNAEGDLSGSRAEVKEAGIRLCVQVFQPEM